MTCGFDARGRLGELARFELQAGPGEQDFAAGAAQRFGLIEDDERVFDAPLPAQKRDQLQRTIDVRRRDRCELLGFRAGHEQFAQDVREDDG